MGKDTNQMRCGKDYKMLLSYCVTVLLSLMLGVCFIFFPKTIWPFYPFVWLLPVAVVLYGLVVVVVNLCRCRWQLFLRSVLIVAVELVILLVVFFSMAILSAIYTDDDGVECQPTLPITVNGEEAIGNAILEDYNYQSRLRPNGWPRDQANWMHSDIKNVAYFYIYDFFDKLTGSPNQ